MPKVSPTGTGRGGFMKRRFTKDERESFKRIAAMVRAKREAINHNIGETPERKEK
jgi:hypothetical protein